MQRPTNKSLAAGPARHGFIHSDTFWKTVAPRRKYINILGTILVLLLVNADTNSAYAQENIALPSQNIKFKVVYSANDIICDPLLEVLNIELNRLLKGIASDKTPPLRHGSPPIFIPGLDQIPGTTETWFSRSLEKHGFDLVPLSNEDPILAATPNDLGGAFEIKLADETDVRRAVLSTVRVLSAYGEGISSGVMKVLKKGERLKHLEIWDSHYRIKEAANPYQVVKAVIDPALVDQQAGNPFIANTEYGLDRLDIILLYEWPHIHNIREIIKENINNIENIPAISTFSVTKVIETQKEKNTLVLITEITNVGALSNDFLLSIVYSPTSNGRDDICYFRTTGESKSPVRRF